MPLNIPGLLVPFQLLIYPRLVLPSLLVKDIRHLDFPALRNAGYRGAVFDKDNCLTIPHKDTLVPELQEAWDTCRETFGEGNVLIVSNSAGTKLDPGGIQAESVSHHLRVPVLFHNSFKPSYSCITAIRTYFLSLPSPIHDDELVIIGDRIFTDVVMANRMRGRSKQRTLLAQDDVIDNMQNEKALDARRQGPLAIWTTEVWKREATVMRYGERKLVDLVQRWTKTTGSEGVDMDRFVKEVRNEPPKKMGMIQGLISRLRTRST